MIRTEWRGFGGFDGKKLLNTRRLMFETVRDIKAHVLGQTAVTGKIKVQVDGFEVADEDRIEEVLEISDSLIIEHVDCDDWKSGRRPTAEEIKPSYVRCMFVDTYIDKRGDQSTEDVGAEFDKMSMRSSKKQIASLSQRQPSPVVSREIVSATLQYPQVLPIPAKKINNSKPLPLKNGKKSTTEKSSDDNSSSENAQPVEIPLKKSKAGIFDFGQPVSAFFEKPSAKPLKTEAPKPTPAPIKQPTIIVLNNVKEEPTPQPAPAPVQPSKVQDAQPKQPLKTSNYFVKSKPMVPEAKKKPVIESDSSSDDDDSSLEMPEKKKPVQKTNAPLPTAIAPAVVAKKVNLNLKVLEPKKASPLDGYEEVCLDSLKELTDAETAKLLHEGLKIHYKVLEMDEEGWDLRLSRDYIEGVIRRYANGVLSIDNMKDGKFDSSDEMHIDVIYDVLISRESEKNKELLDRVVKKSKDTEEMQDHKEKYQKLAEVDQSMNEQEKNISHQVNYYFGDKNYFKDKFIQNHIDHDEDKAFNIELLLNFNKVKEFSKDMNIIESALRKFEASSMCTYKFVEGKKKIYKKTVTR